MALSSGEFLVDDRGQPVDEQASEGLAGFRVRRERAEPDAVGPQDVFGRREDVVADQALGAAVGLAFGADEFRGERLQHRRLGDGGVLGLPAGERAAEDALDVVRPDLVPPVDQQDL
jgi:hypothetical protein